MEHTAISLIIPVYRVKEHLPACLDSLLNQDFCYPYNIILVESNSDDGSDRICAEYEKKFSSRIFYFHYDKNDGISVGRNIGILHSNGDYVCFIDGDDYIWPTFLSTLYSAASKNSFPDIITASYQIDDGDKHKIIKSSNYSISSEKALARFFNSKNENFYCWNRLFKRRFLIDNHLYFDQRFNMFEDLLFVAKAMARAEKIVSINDVIYHYVQHESSTVHLCKDFLSPRLKAYEEIKNDYHFSYPLYERKFFAKPSKKIKKQIKQDCLKSAAYYNLTAKKLHQQAKAKLKGIFSV